MEECGWRVEGVGWVGGGGMMGDSFVVVDDEGGYILVLMSRLGDEMLCRQPCSIELYIS